MAHWLATAPQTHFIFNDLVSGKFVSVIFDMAAKTRRVAPYPVSAVSADGKWAVSINLWTTGARENDETFQNSSRMFES